MTGATGVHDLYFRFSGGAGELFNVDWWRFDGGPPAGRSPPPTVTRTVCLRPLADPTPPDIDDVENLGVEIEDLVEQMKDMSERELMDQVYRRMTILLCRPCYVRWIDRPAG